MLAFMTGQVRVRMKAPKDLSLTGVIRKCSGRGNLRQPLIIELKSRFEFYPGFLSRVTLKPQKRGDFNRNSCDHLPPVK